ncbi:MAG: hypothetical protein ACK4KW_02315 [Gemmobacter sp.]
MLEIGALILGAVWGGLLARRRKGSRLDIAQYAAVFGIIFALVAVIVRIAAIRLL